MLATAAGGLAALAGCATGGGEPTSRPTEATVTVRIENRDAVAREYRVAVRQGGTTTNEFSGVLPADESVEMVARLRPTAEQHEVIVETAGGGRGRTWDPEECPDLLVDAAVEGGEPRFEATCRGG